ncbi:glutamyl-tRNA synthetase [Pustulibacterium marinum]|uniref:Glutamate--tRNA ligase n=1 Tax=Pustulibacterium marinum TaxID=1224947 RepID=A0A1I7ETE2_9FLAO|nr:glutamate--tRNA ligase [Pustulibacterium marinum]SFU27195.1 glutamyl-tRNA synthetase [Pustulibacterium marinum]
MSKKVRVRFAPSPTGPLHIGGVRTALFNYLFAKKHNGTFYVRIEDTDQTRFVPGAEAYIFEALEWLGIAPDETVGKNEQFGPYKQSERKHLYKDFAEELIAKGKAYYAFDKPEALAEARKACEAEGKTFIYNWENRGTLENSFTLSKEEVAEKIANGEAYVVRFNMYTPDAEEANITTTDLIRGEVSFKKELLDDKVLFKSDGMPTYHLANIVDDHLMETSHVIRGEEWLPSLPLHIALYEAFGWKKPEFAHLPLILKPVGNGKLSKRDGDKMGFPVFPLEWKTEETTSMGYREQGYFPQAVVNFLALLGWNDGTDKELFSLKELTETFDLDRVNKSGAKFDPEKNKWFNHQYLQQKSDAEIAELFAPIVHNHVETPIETITTVVGLVKERANFVNELWDLSDYFFVNPTEYDAKASKKQWKEQTPTIMQELIAVLEGIEDFTSSNTETIVKEWLTEKGYGFGQVMPPFRLSLVGAMKGPHVFDIAAVLGKETSIERIQKAIDTLS